MLALLLAVSVLALVEFGVIVLMLRKIGNIQ